ncbi:MAG: CHASE domain-containing protein [Novosphingobium sp.]|nr:CHASE domain-containing protein [Novosphingobium sp.]
MDKALLARAEKQAWFHRYPRGWPLLLFALTALGTLLAVVGIERVELQRRELELDKKAIEITSGLQRRASENIALLDAGAALLSSYPKLTAQDFAGISEALYGRSETHGSMGLGWAPRVDVASLPAFEAARRAEGQPAFSVFPAPAPRRGIVVPVLFISPPTRDNQGAVGFDMYSEAVRRQAMDAATAQRRPVASCKVTLIQDVNRQGTAGFLIYRPVFARPGGGGAIRGFVYSPFRASEFLNSAAELVGDQQVEISLYDEAPRPDRLLALRAYPGESGMSLDRRITVANRHWVLRVGIKKPGTLSALSRVTLAFGLVLALLTAMIARMVTRRAAEDRQVLEWLTRESAIRNSLTRELNHRVKNTLANVLSIVALTRRRASTIDELAESLTGRGRARSATHDLLSHSDWSDAPVEGVIRSELAPYMGEHDSHVELSGPEISLAPNDALSLGLAIHELATNAAKYGALSCDTGRIHIAWQLVSPEVAEVHWREEGGPLVVPPAKRGFGRDLLEKIVAHELRSAVDLQFHPAGVECRLRVPVRRLSDFELRRRPLV